MTAPDDVAAMIERLNACDLPYTEALINRVRKDGRFPVDGTDLVVLTDFMRLCLPAAALLARLQKEREENAYYMKLAKEDAEQLRAEREWQPIESAPKQKVILLWAITDTELPNWKMATGCWMPGYGDDPGAWEWDGRRLKAYDVQPTHWMPLPEAPQP